MKTTLCYSDLIPNSSPWKIENLTHFESELQYQSSDLGDRMSHALQSHLSLKNSAILIGSDCPALSSSHLFETAKILKTKTDVVIGPAIDGGFYLIGASRWESTWFDGIEWSTEKVCSRLIKNLDKHKVSYSLLSILPDIDTLKDWQQWGHLVQN